jgi:hypothetical protein
MTSYLRTYQVELVFVRGRLLALEWVPLLREVLFLDPFATVETLDFTQPGHAERLARFRFSMVADKQPTTPVALCDALASTLRPALPRRSFMVRVSMGDQWREGVDITHTAERIYRWSELPS